MVGGITSGLARVSKRATSRWLRRRVDRGRWRGDLRGGPALLLPSGGQLAELFLHYQASRNPLGIGHSALLAGFAYSDDPAPVLPRVDRVWNPIGTSWCAAFLIEK